MKSGIVGKQESSAVPSQQPPKLEAQYTSTPSRTFSHNTCSGISRSRFKLKLKSTAQPEQTRPDLQ